MAATASKIVAVLTGILASLASLTIYGQDDPPPQVNRCQAKNVTLKQALTGSYGTNDDWAGTVKFKFDCYNGNQTHCRLCVCTRFRSEDVWGNEGYLTPIYTLTTTANCNSTGNIKTIWVTLTGMVWGKAYTITSYALPASDNATCEELNSLYGIEGAESSVEVSITTFP